VHSVILAMSVTYYPLGAQVMTLVLPLGFFIVVMAALYFVFTRPHTVPGRRPIGGARAVAPADAGHAASLAAATGLPTATAAGGPEPLAGRGTPPSVGVRTEEAVQQAAKDAAQEAKDAAGAARDKVTGGSDKDQDAATEGSEDQE
jgi:hypothetical protein